MTDVLIFDALNVMASLIVFGIIAFKLMTRAERFTPIERFGMALLAAGCVMTIGPITHRPSPYDDWAAMLMRMGAATYFVGRITRHRYNNWQMRRQARRRM
ncbi:hypothetical protein [Novosphingobium sp. HII-3]|uniref:hypothetical protein n=1 Tax=Novosphingobium sp. HII-3 TaxID=2075565 RepID=UPI000CDB5F64|nr:hypothetical protein [Novosphingobium sp. HII-3]